MAAGPWRFYNSAKLNLFKLGLQSSHPYWMALFSSSGNSTTLTLDELGDTTGQVADGFGYDVGGKTIAGETWAATTSDATVMRFDSSNVTWTATGGSITAYSAVIYAKVTAGGLTNPLLCHCRLNSTGTTVTVTADNTLTVQISTGGIFTLSGGTS